MLNSADKELKKIDGLTYVRYCDDMIVLHPTKELCKLAIEKYDIILKNKLLFTHPVKEHYSRPRTYGEGSRRKIKNNGVSKKKYSPITLKPFWDGKSKGPYQWTNLDTIEFKFPWIGFVGYELRFTGEVRVRRSSLKKEVEKQRKVTRKILKMIDSVKVRRNGYILKSASQKLIGMGVGRVTIHNYKTVRHELCWKNGFSVLNKNSDTVRQMKKLDRHRNLCLARLNKRLGVQTVKSEKDVPKNIVDYNRPFSYFYHVLIR
jgi:hypothetical protein